MRKPDPGPTWSLSPKEWGARVDYDQWNDRYTPDDGVVLHNGGNGNYPAAIAPYTAVKEIDQLRRWEDYHIDGRGWRGLAYGWAIGQSGICYRVRGWNTYGAHQGDIDGDGIPNNAELLPVLWIASGLHHTPSEAFHATFTRLRVYQEETTGRVLRLAGHQEVQPKPTSCPGPNGMVYVRAHRFLPAPQPPNPDPEPEPEPGEEIEMRQRTEGLARLDADAHTHNRPCPLAELGDAGVVGQPADWWHTMFTKPDDPAWYQFWVSVDIRTAINSARP